MTKPVVVVLAAVLTTFTLGCTTTPAETPRPDAGAADVPAQVPDASVTLPAEAQPEPKVDARADTPAEDAPRPWPPPGTDYLTRLETEADFDRLSGPMRKGVPFIMRRRVSDKGYPYPWDAYECVFENSRYLHLEFLEAMDPARALYLYYADARGLGGNLIPGRLDLDRTRNPKVVTVLFENHAGLTARMNDFPLDATTGAFLREQLRRCVPLVGSFTISMVCPGGQAFDCPLP